MIDQCMNISNINKNVKLITNKVMPALKSFLLKSSIIRKFCGISKVKKIF
jgi:hypothetical protein